MKVFFSLSGIVPHKKGILFSFEKPKEDPRIPFCYFNYPKVIFGNVLSEEKPLKRNETEFLKKLFFHFFNSAVSWQAAKCVDPFTCKGVSREETFLEKQFLLTLFLETYREFYSFYSAFFFLYFFHKELLLTDIYSEITLRLRCGFTTKLKLWEILTVPVTAYCMILDYNRDFLTYVSENMDKKLLINNLVGHLMSSKLINKEINSLKELLLSRGFIISSYKPNLSESHSSFSTYSRILPKEGKGI